MENELKRKLLECVSDNRILINEPMYRHTTFRVGGDADFFVEVDTTEELQALLRLDCEKYLIGNGSNLLVSDRGLRGVVLHLSQRFAEISVTGNLLVCKAGATLAAIARTACGHSLTGFEFAAGIPGSLGGAVVMNAGAYDGEMRQVIRRVTLLRPDGTVVEKSAEEMHFAYRHSLLKEESGLIVLEAELELAFGEQAAIKAAMDDLAQRRRSRQPLEYPSAGSTFKRPKGYFAAKLIEDAGLKGFRVGDAQVSEKHCGFVINRGNASARDIYCLITAVQKRVKETFDVQIEPEVICLGAFD
ncbi:MAG: UDP-N-acetylmuramate dehydrogenase [Roseburia sp.]|nr:UDP-N-acetylmuramate dehydrogenase [Roseburia sp.]